VRDESILMGCANTVRQRYVESPLDEIRHAMRIVDSQPVIWVDKVVMLILLANRFCRGSILSHLPADIARIIARKVYCMLDMWL
jgi:hypothetical protein